MNSNRFRTAGLFGVILFLVGTALVGRFVSGTVAVILAVALIGLLLATWAMLHHATHMRIVEARTIRRRQQRAKVAARLAESRSS